MRIATVTKIANTIAETLKGNDALQAAADLRERLVAGILRHKSLDAYQMFGATPARLDEANEVDIRLTFRKAISPWFASELLFELKGGAFRGYARTLHVTDGRGYLSPNAVVARNGEMSEEVFYYSVDGMGRAAAERVLEQRVALLADLGFAVEPTVLKRFSKVGNESAAPFVL